MRIRTFKPEIFASKDFRTLDFCEQILFLGLLSYVDDNGVGVYDDVSIATSIFPEQVFMNPHEILMRIHEGFRKFLRRKMVYVFRTNHDGDSRTYLYIVNWDKHQRVGHPSKPRYPRPDEDSTLEKPWNDADSEHPDSDDEPVLANPHESLMNPHEGLMKAPVILTRNQGTGNREQGTGNRERVCPTNRHPSQPVECDTSEPSRSGTDVPSLNARPAETAEVNERTDAPANGDMPRDPAPEDPAPGQETLPIAVEPYNEPPVSPPATSPKRTRKRQHQYSAEFDRFWQIYPRHVAKAKAAQSFTTAVKDGADPEAIVEGARRYAKLMADQNQPSRYIAHPSSWLNQARWTDEETPGEQGGQSIMELMQALDRQDAARRNGKES